MLRIACLLALTACGPAVVVRPRAPVPTHDAPLDAALALAVHDFAQSVEYRDYEMGAVYAVSEGWHVEQRHGVTYGRSKAVDALMRSARYCYVVHFVVVQAFDGQSYQESYTANRSSAFPQGPETPREDIACSDFHS